MTHYSIDVRYAWAQLGLNEGAAREWIRATVVNAKIYRYSTRERIKHVERFAAFFKERERLGAPQDSFEAIRKAYHREAMALHPDRNRDDPNAEEELKSINAAYEIIEAVYKEARAYFRQNEELQRETETRAREATEREAAAAGQSAQPHTVNMSYEEAKAQTRPRPAPEANTAPPVDGIKYMAASVPRFIRNARLFYLGRDAIIGSRMMGTPGKGGMIYDVIMLPQREFMRARLRLTVEGYGVQELSFTKLTPPYIPQDIKEITVPPDEDDPESFAKNHFRREYGLP